MCTRLALLGDCGSGKTSLIHSFVYGPNEDGSLPELGRVLPAMSQLIPQGQEEVQLAIIDTPGVPHDVDISRFSSEAPETESAIKDAVSTADAVAVVFDSSIPYAMERVIYFWLPLLAQMSPPSQVIFVANKYERVDLSEGSESHIAFTMGTARIVEAAEEQGYARAHMVCSSVPGGIGISDVFDTAAQWLVASRFWMNDLKHFKPECENALRRIFHLSRPDNKGRFSKDALENPAILQKLLGHSADVSEVESMLSLIESKFPDSLDQYGLTLSGYMNLIEETLRDSPILVVDLFSAWGYNSDLLLTINYPEIDVMPDQAIELTLEARELLNNAFTTFDLDCDEALSPSELLSALSIVPPVFDLELESMPSLASAEEPSGAEALSQEVMFKEYSILRYLQMMSPSAYCIEKDIPLGEELNLTETPEFQFILDSIPKNPDGKVGEKGWIVLWRLVASLHLPLALRFFRYLGFEGNLAKLFEASQPRMEERRSGKVQRRTLHAFLFGASGCGKTSLLYQFLRQPTPRVRVPSTEIRCAANLVRLEDEEDAGEYLLVIHEFPDTMLGRVLHSESLWDSCDCVVMAYDGNDPFSFSFVATVQNQISDRGVPCTYVLTKSDLTIVDQHHPVTPDRFCAQWSLPWPPTLISHTDEELFCAFDERIVNVCLYPDLSLPIPESVTRRRRFIKRAITLTILGAGIGYMVSKTLKKKAK